MTQGKRRGATPTVRAGRGRATSGPAAARNGYDLTSADTSRDRRRASVEMGDDDAILGARGRLVGTAQLRNLWRNYSSAKAFMFQFRLWCVGQKIMLHTPDATWNRQAEHWFNSTWAKTCDGRDDRHLDDLNGAVLLSVQREHDCVGYFDAAGIIEYGKLYFWESDQVCEIADKDWKDRQPDIAASLGVAAGTALNQTQGVVRDQWGKALGYIVTSERGQTVQPYATVTVLRRGPARLFKHPWRLNQSRGASELMSAAANLIDAHEMLMAELAAGKTAAHLALKVKKNDPTGAAMGRIDSSDTLSAQPSLATAAKSGLTNYKNYEKLSRGAIEYLAPNEDVEVLENDRPGPRVLDFVTFQTLIAGASVGLPRLFSLLKADASYSASRAEGVLGEQCFKHWRKWLERYVLDWEAQNALIRGMASGALPKREFADWAGLYSWEHPKLPPIDEAKDAQAAAQDLKTCRRTLQDCVGPRWLDKITQRGKEIAAMQAAGVPLDEFLDTGSQPDPADPDAGDKESPTTDEADE